MKMSLKIGNTNERGEINIKHARKWRIMYTDMYRERRREREGEKDVLHLCYVISLISKKRGIGDK